MAVGADTIADGFSWSGSLDETDIRALYAACHSLKFSGWLELKDASHEARVIFLGGEPVEIAGGDTNAIALWSHGTFRAIQSIPDLQGDLTEGREVRGSLRATKPSALWAWISQFRLSCEIELERPGSRAVVTFQNGHAEAAEVNGMPELAALARVSSWTDGEFYVRLRPLFVSGVVPVAPPMPDSAPLRMESGPAFGAKLFDVSRAMPLVTEDGTPWPGERELDSGEQQVLPPGRPSGTGSPSAQGSPAMVPKPPVPRVESTAVTRTGSQKKLDEETVPSLAPRRSALPWVIAIALTVVAGSTVALYRYRLPPFSPPPKPIEAALPAVPAPVAAPAAPVEEKPPMVAEEKPAEPAPVAAGEKPAEKPSKKDVAFDKLVTKGRLLLVTGHPHSALGNFRRAEKLKPKDPSIKILADQAQGKLGRAELSLEGKGSIIIDGKKFSAPKKLKLPAGPHVVDGDELVLNRGEKKKLRVKK